MLPNQKVFIFPSSHLGSLIGTTITTLSQKLGYFSQVWFQSLQYFWRRRMQHKASWQQTDDWREVMAIAQIKWPFMWHRVYC